MKLFDLQLSAGRIVGEMGGLGKLLCYYPNEHHQFTDQFGYSYKVYSGDGSVLVKINNVVMRVRYNIKDHAKQVIERVPRYDQDYQILIKNKG